MPLRDARLLDRVLVSLGRRAFVRVEGESMQPELFDGDLVIIDRAAPRRIGDIVVAAHPFKNSTNIVKRLESIDDNGRFFLVGDNRGASTDSRQFGSISPFDVLGKAVAAVRGGEQIVSI